LEYFIMQMQERSRVSRRVLVLRLRKIVDLFFSLTLVALVKVGRSLLFPFFSVVLFLFAFPSLLIGSVLWWRATVAWDRDEYWRWVSVSSVLGGVVYVGWNMLASPLPWILSLLLHSFTWDTFMEVVGLFWLFHLLLAPACAFLLAMLCPTPRVVLSPLKDVSLREVEHEEREAEREALIHLEQMSAALQQGSPGGPVLAAPTTQAVPIVCEPLGMFQGGELSELVYGGELCLLSDLLELHGVLVGEPRAGKTYTLLQLARIAQSYGRKVIYLDLKGSRKTAALFLALMTMVGVKKMKVYPLEAYDGWRGDSQALFNRLMEQIDPGSHPFYRGGVGATAVSLALRAPGGLPKNSQQFLERLNHGWLKAAYRADTQALREIRDIAPYLSGVVLTFAGFFRGIAGGLDGSWAFEDVDACYLGIDGSANKEEAAALGRYLLEDAAHYATSRKAPDAQALLIVDEFGVLRSTNATDLYERTREAGLSIYAAAQSYHGLGKERDQILAAAATKILHRSGNPEAIVRYAGQRERFTFSRGIGMNGGDDEEVFRPLMNRPAGELGIHTVARPSREYTVPVEDVQQLAVGQIVLIWGGKSAYAQVHPLHIPQQLVQAATRLMKQAVPETQAPSPLARAQMSQGDQRNQHLHRGKQVVQQTVSQKCQQQNTKQEASEINFFS
jgi:hypothetical protein